MKIKVMTAIAAAMSVLFTVCTSTETASNRGLSLHEAIEQSADKIVNDLNAKSAVAVVAFESEHDNLSAHIMEELNGALFDRGMVVIEREHLEYVQRELHYQMSGDVSDESAQTIGKFFGAELVVTGRLTDLGGIYRYQVNAIAVETATRGSVARLDVANNSSMRRMVMALAGQSTTVRVARYAVTEQTVPQTATEYLNKGIMFAMRGDYGRAITEFDEALRINPNLVGAYMLRARALYASVSRVVGTYSNFSGLITTRTEGQITTDQARIYNRAIADYTQVIRLEPDNAYAYTSRGLVYGRLGDNGRAIADHTEAIRLAPHYGAAYINRGSEYDDMGDYDRAIADHTEAIRLNSNDGTAYYNRGNAYNRKGDYDRAIADYTDVIRLRPDDFSALMNRGVAYARKGDYDSAIADYTEVIRLDPNVAIASITEEVFGMMLIPDPAAATVFFNRGVAYQEKDDFDQAIADYTEAIRINPNFAQAYDNRAVVYANQGDFNRAIADWEAVLRINPNDLGARQNIERVRQIERQRNIIFF